MPPSLQKGIAAQQQKKSRGGTKVLIDESKKEQFNVLSGFRGLVKKLRSEWTVESNTDEISDGTFINCRIFIIPAPRAKSMPFGSFSKMAEANPSWALTSITFSRNCVIRTVFYKYFDPKEALVSNGIINRAIPTAAGKPSGSDQNANAQSLAFVYPYGCTLNINRSSSAVLSTGSTCFPVSRPIAAFHTHEESNGRMVVVGSSHLFHDTYIDKEDNAKILKVFMDFLNGEVDPNKMDASEPDLTDYYPVPDHIYLSEQLKVPLSEGDTDTSLIGSDFMKLFDAKLTSFDFSKWPSVIKAYDELNVKADRLSFITPTFEVPILRLQPAVFPPNFRELPPPDLEMFDLDEMFSSREVRLTQLVYKCEEKDLEYFIREAGDACDVTTSLPANDRTARRILERVLHHLIEYKKNNIDDDDSMPADDHLFNVPTGNLEADFSDLDDYDD
ncbi:osm-6 [Pristionchus pacificus]|uniref:Osm-6 n=1 Tax=Pristionchus pacificus TaxID=54126 RepID=A0A2A6BRN9_PRIPA|nr:osm-6 [Pristionchus pacificus]|eukprot:PDM68570.1 osm-6 [Pristionchus pacificus]